MGGGTDPTVLCRPLACVITGVSLDHTAILGDTLEKIAQEKAGIINRACLLFWECALPSRLILSGIGRWSLTRLLLK